MNPSNCYSNREIWNSNSPSRVYMDEMKDLGRGLNLLWQDDSTGSVSSRTFVLYKMESKELKSLQRELVSAGLSREANQIREYRNFRAERLIEERKALLCRRERLKELVVKHGINLGEIPVSKLDSFIYELWGRPVAYAYV